jgi:hypothetical protein
MCAVAGDLDLTVDLSRLGCRDPHVRAVARVEELQEYLRVITGDVE